MPLTNRGLVIVFTMISVVNTIPLKTMVFLFINKKPLQRTKDDTEANVPMENDSMDHHHSTIQQTMHT